MTEKLIVPFAGEGSGTGELSWGQKTVWRGVLMRGQAIWLVSVREVPRGTTIEAIADDMAFLVGRHQALRTTLIVHSDDDVRQVVHASGELTIEIEDIADDADPKAAADATEAMYDIRDRDYASDWPLQVTIIRQRGVPAYRVIAFCHTSVDGFSTLTINTDLDRRDPVTGEAAEPVTAMLALEQAAIQTSPVGQKRSATVERHWERMLRAIPACRFPEPAQKLEPRYWKASFRSPALHLASQVVARRMGQDTSPVLLAAFAVGMVTVGGSNPAVPRLMVNNRFRPRLAESVSPLSQTCLCPIDVTGITFDEAVGRAYRASFVAFKNAYFEPVRIREILAAVSMERGEELDVNLLYNDRRSIGGAGEVGDSAGLGREVIGELATLEEIRAALCSTTLDLAGNDVPMDLCHLFVVPALGSIDVDMYFDAHYVSPEHAQKMLRTMEEVTVAAALDPTTTTGV